jgi:hypothetical protein
MFEFDGDNKIITVSGLSSFAFIDLYREAREWEDDQANMQYTSPLDAVGKESLKPDVYTDIVYILMNGWKLKPSGYTSGSTVQTEGTIITDDNSSPTIPATVGSPITWVMQVASSGIIVNVSTGSGLSTEEHNQLMALPTESSGLTEAQDAKLTNIDTNVTDIETDVGEIKQIAEDNQALIISN